MKMDTWDRVANLFQGIEGKIAEELRKTSDLGVSEFKTLKNLRSQPKREMRMQELAELLQLTQSSTTRLVERLEAREFVYRDTCQSDGRGKYCVITDAGQRYVEEAIPAFERALERVLSTAFKDEEARQAARDLAAFANS